MWHGDFSVVSLQIPPRSDNVASTIAYESIAKELKQSKPIPPPQEFIHWLENVKCAEPNTVKLYKIDIGKFLRCMELFEPGKTPRLEMAYDSSACTDFFTVLKHIYHKSTITNFHNALQAVRKFLRFHDRVPASYASRLEGFATMAQVAQAAKKKDLRLKRQHLQSKGKSNIMTLFYRRFYHGPIWTKVFRILNRLKAQVDSKKPVKKLSKSDLYLLNSCLIGACTITNFKRPGNFTQIKFNQAWEELLKAVRKFERKFPSTSMVLGKGRLDRQFCFPAVLMIDDSVKTSNVEYAVLLHPRDVYAAFLYAKYARPNGPQPPSTESFFINSRGGSLGQNVCRYLQSLGDMTNVKGLSFNVLRALAETENMVEDRLPGSSSEATHHLGHSERVRDEYYVLRDRRHYVQAANRLLFACEEAGELKEDEEDEETDVEEEEDKEETEEEVEEEEKTSNDDGDNHSDTNQVTF